MAKKIKRGDDFKAYDFCDCTHYTLTALEDEDKDGVIKAEFDDDYILYAQVEENNDGEMELCIDTGDCH
jgi:hypothetical protein